MRSEWHEPRTSIHRGREAGSTDQASIDSAEVIDLLTGLIGKSLVVVDSDTGRYHLPETIRHYALSRLKDSGDETLWRSRHLAHFLAWARDEDARAAGSDPRQWISSLVREYDNLRAALAWAVSAPAASPAGLELAVALALYWELRGLLFEGRSWLSALLQRESGRGDPDLRARALSWSSRLALQQGDYASARRLSTESLDIRRELGDRPGIANSLNSLGNVASNAGDYALALQRYEQSLEIWKELGDWSGVAAALNNLGNVAYRQHEYAAARAFLEEALAIKRRLDDRWSLAYSLGNLGNVAAAQGDLRAAQPLFRESLSIFRELGATADVAVLLEMLAAVIAGLDGPLPAARVWGAAQRLRDEIYSPLPASDYSRREEYVRSARTTLNDDDAFEAAWKEGRAMPLDQVLDYALGCESAM